MILVIFCIKSEILRTLLVQLSHAISNSQGKPNRVSKQPIAANRKWLKGKSKQSGFDFEMTGNSKIVVFELVGSKSILN